MPTSLYGSGDLRSWSMARPDRGWAIDSSHKLSYRFVCEDSPSKSPHTRINLDAMYRPV